MNINFKSSFLTIHNIEKSIGLLNQYIQAEFLSYYGP